MEDKEVVDLGAGRPLEFIHTRGHAKHHFVVHDTQSKRYEPNSEETIHFLFRVSRSHPQHFLGYINSYVFL